MSSVKETEECPKDSDMILASTFAIIERVAKINGVIPDKSLVTVDQRAMKFEEPVTFQINPDFVGIDELAKRAAERDDNEY